jgi:peptidoglycan/LPS O-acetylase OafA/YrhL
MAAEGERKLLPALTGIRFLAAYFVVLFHFSLWYFAGAPQPIKDFMGSGYVGVDLFFVLSGFVLAYTYMQPHTTRISRRKFWVARLARIYPMYVVALLLSLPLTVSTVLHSSHHASDVLVAAAGVSSAVVLLQAWLPQTATVINGPGWSLSVEALFYLIFPLTGLVFLRMTSRRLVAAGAALWLAALAVPILFTLVQGPILRVPETPSQDVLAVMYNPVLHLPAFFLGVVAEIAYARGLGRIVGAWGAPVGLLVAGAVLAFSSHIPFLLLQNGLLAPIFALTIVGLAEGRGLLPRILGSRFMQILGEASYSIYILQVPLWFGVLAVVTKVLHPKTPPYLGRPAYFLAFSLLLIGVSVAALFIYEAPARRAIRGAFGVRRPIPDAPGALDLAANVAR